MSQWGQRGGVNGAKGYLIKNHTPEHLKQMIKSVYYGTGVMEESLLESLAADAGKAGWGTMATEGFDPAGYTDRELDIVKAVSEGLSHRTALAVYYLTGKK